MTRFFKKEEPKPYTYSSIEMRKSSNKFVWWIAGVIALILILGIFFLI